MTIHKARCCQVSNKAFPLTWAIVLILILTFRTAYSVDETFLFERFQAGEIDTIRSMTATIPESTAVGTFFRGVFETDGEAARFYYDRIVALWPGSTAEAWALERLWQYHWSMGDGAQAGRYFDFLQQRHPDHPGLVNKPDFGSDPGLEELIMEPGIIPEEGELIATTPGRWRVQLGAFSQRSGAKKVARQMTRFGVVDLIPKTVNGKKLIVVTVGRLHQKREAEQLAEKIRATTGIKGIVVAAEDRQ